MLFQAVPSCHCCIYFQFALLNFGDGSLILRKSSFEVSTKMNRSRLWYKHQLSFKRVTPLVLTVIFGNFAFKNFIIQTEWSKSIVMVNYTLFRCLFLKHLVLWWWVQVIWTLPKLLWIVNGRWLWPMPAFALGFTISKKKKNCYDIELYFRSVYAYIV